MKMWVLGTSRTFFQPPAMGPSVQLPLALPSPVRPVLSSSSPFASLITYRSSDSTYSDLPFLVQYCHYEATQQRGMRCLARCAESSQPRCSLGSSQQLSCCYIAGGLAVLRAAGLLLFEFFVSLLSTSPALELSNA